MPEHQPLDARQIIRERLLFQYTGALERGDFALVAAILREAERDPVLERMILEVNVVCAEEVPDRMPDSNHHSTRKVSDPMTVMIYSHSRTVSKPNWQFITLAAAVLAVVLIGGLLFLNGRKPPVAGPDSVALVQGQASPTFGPSPITTQTATPIPIVVQGGASPTALITTLTPAVLCEGKVQFPDGVNLFSRSNVNAVIVGRVPYGTDLEVLDQEIGTADGNRWYFVRAATGVQGWIRADVNSLLVNCPVPSTLNPPPTGYPPSPFPEAPETAAFKDAWGGQAWLITREVVGDIPANTLVLLISGWWDGTAWRYTITTDDHSLSATARESQLAYAPGYEPVVSTPTAEFSSSIGMGFLLVTRQPVGDIPGGIRVRISSARFDGREWIYAIVPEYSEEVVAEAYAWQLTYAPGVTPGATPTSVFGPNWGSAPILTRVDIENIPAGALVQITSGWFRGPEWEYTIISADGRLSATALESQLTFAPGYPPPTPTPSAMYAEVMGYNLMTTELVGDIAANTPVQAASAWYDGTDWRYTIITEDGRQADVLQRQITYAPYYRPGAPTAMFHLPYGFPITLMVKEQIGHIAANTWVEAMQSYYDGTEWVYEIRQGTQNPSVLALESQLMRPQTVTPTALSNGATFTPTPLPLRGPSATPTPSPLRGLSATPTPVRPSATPTPVR